MNIIADLHTHTTASDHAYSTIMENAAFANKIGLKAIAITNHGPAIIDGAHRYHFLNLVVLDRYINDVFVIRGAEVNITDYEGNVDLDESYLSKLEWVIASYHQPVCESGTKEQHTNSLLELCKNKYIDAIGHSGSDAYIFDYERVIPEFKKYGKIVEINANSFNIRQGSKENCREIALLCKKHEVTVCVNSDAHYAGRVGDVLDAITMLKDIDFPEELIINTDINRLLTHINNKRGLNLLSR